MAFDPDAYLGGGTATNEFDPDAYLATPTPAPTAVAETGEGDGFLAKINAALRKPSPEGPLRNFEESTRENVLAMMPHDLPSYLRSVLGPVGHAYEQGKALAQGDVSSIPLVGRVPEIIAADETPAFSKERIGTSERVLMDLGALAGAGEGAPRLPLRAEPAVPPATDAAALAQKITQPRVEPPTVPQEPLAPVTPETQPAPGAAAPIATQQAAGIIDRGLGEQFRDPTGAIDTGKFGDAVAAQVQEALSRGDSVTFVTDYGRKQVPITSVNRGMMTDAQGQRWGAISILTDAAERVEITPKKPPSPGASTVPPVPPEDVPFTPEGKHVTSIKKAVTAAEREARGLPAADTVARRDFGTVWDESAKIVADKPETGRALVDELNQKPRALTDTEDAILLRRQIEAQQEHSAAVEELNANPSSETAEIRLDRARDEVQAIYDAAESAGTATGRGLNARKLLADEDYSLANMEATYRATANKGNPLTREQTNKVAGVHKKIWTNEQRIKASITRLERQHLEYLKRLAEGNTDPLYPKREALTNKARDRALFLRDMAKREFQEMVWDAKLKNQELHQKALRYTGETLRVARSVKTSIDVSAVMRQGGFNFFSHPIDASRAIGPMFRGMASERGQFQVMRDIVRDPDYVKSKQAGLFLADIETPRLTQMEEAYASRFARNIPGVSHSERAYVTYLNKIRFDRFKAMRSTLGGKPGITTAAEDKIIANFVNVTSGRGNLGRFQSGAELMNATFFAPRYVVSRFQTMFGQPLYHMAGKGSWRVRRLIAKEYVRTAAGLATFLGTLAASGWATINTDRHSSDFMKIRMGDTRIDPMFGLQQGAVFLSRVIEGKTTTAAGEERSLRGPGVKYGSDTTADIIKRFLWSKLGPVPGATMNVLEGKNVVGQPTSLINEIVKLPMPMSIGEFTDAMKAEGVPQQLTTAILAALGMGASTYTPSTKEKRNRAIETLKQRDEALMEGDLQTAAERTWEMGTEQ